jgi:hypothetical protein
MLARSSLALADSLHAMLTRSFLALVNYRYTTLTRSSLALANKDLMAYARQWQWRSKRSRDCVPSDCQATSKASEDVTGKSEVDRQEVPKLW